MNVTLHHMRYQQVGITAKESTDSADKPRKTISLCLTRSNKLDSSGSSETVMTDRYSFDSSGHVDAQCPRSSKLICGRPVASCLKVKTQRESLARISLRFPEDESTMLTMESEFSDVAPLAVVYKMVRFEKMVRFDTVEFREYARILSDNPSTTAGPPIGLDWRYDPKDTVTLDVNSYESYRDGAESGERTRRTKQELIIPSDVRQEMLREAGYSRQEIAAAVRNARKVKERRTVSFHQQKYDPIYERVETLRHGIKRIILKKCKDASLHDGHPKASLQ